MKKNQLLIASSLGVLTVIALTLTFNSHKASLATSAESSAPVTAYDVSNETSALQMLRQGRDIFRYDTFGDEAFWGDALLLHQSIAGEKNGGVGQGLSPKGALAAGLKVDVDALPNDVQSALKAGAVDLDSPSTTITLLKANAVVGVKGIFNSQGQLKSIGIQCALCHSTVDNSLAPGIGHRLDGWPARDLNVGAIISMSRNLKPVTDLLGVDEVTVKNVLAAWGPGRFDAVLFLDGKGFRPDGATASVLIPPAFGLAGVNLHTYVGWGSVTYWNAFVANLEMHGQGTLFDTRLDDAEKFPIAARAQMGHTRSSPDLITEKLAPLHLYQLSLKAPQAPEGSFNRVSADRGKKVFEGKASCIQCHVPPIFTEPGWNMHSAEEIGIDDFQAKRSPDEKYRTTPLKGLFTRMKGGFYHDGRFKDLPAVVNHYDQFKGLGLTQDEKSDLVEYLKSL